MPSTWGWMPIVGHHSALMRARSPSWRACSHPPGRKPEGRTGGRTPGGPNAWTIRGSSKNVNRGGDHAPQAHAGDVDRYVALNKLIVGLRSAEEILEAVSSPRPSQNGGRGHGGGGEGGGRRVNAVNVATALGKLAHLARERACTHSCIVLCCPGGPPAALYSFSSASFTHESFSTSPVLKAPPHRPVRVPPLLLQGLPPASRPTSGSLSSWASLNVSSTTPLMSSNHATLPKLHGDYEPFWPAQTTPGLFRLIACTAPQAQHGCHAHNLCHHRPS